MTTRSSRFLRFGLLLSAMLAAPHAFAVPITVDFEAFADTESVTTQVAGLTFANTVVLTAGISLNEFDFPPHSGTKVVTGLGLGPITIDFSSPLDSFAAYFTYNAAVTIQAFDGASTLLGSVTSAFSTNYATDSDPASAPNELLQLAGIGAISRVSIASGTDAFNLTMDDLLATPRENGSVVVPEPGTLALLFAGCCAFALRRRVLARRA